MRIVVILSTGTIENIPILIKRIEPVSKVSIDGLKNRTGPGLTWPGLTIVAALLLGGLKAKFILNQFCRFWTRHGFSA